MLDSQSQFSGSVGVDGSRTPQGPITSTQVSTNVLDLRTAAPLSVIDEGLQGGGEVWVFLQVMQSFNNLTSLTISVESDSTANLATAPVVHASRTVPLANLTAGASVRIQLPADDYKRYLGLRYMVTGAAPSAGTVTAFMTFDPQNNKIYAGNLAMDV